MKIVVFGASGATGRLLVRQGLDRDHQVTAFVRDPAKLDVAHARLTVVQGDVGDAPAVARAVEGQEAVLSTLGVGRPLRHDPTVIRGVGHVVRAMESAGVRRLVYLSTVGVRESRADAGLMIRLFAAGPIRQEVRDHEAKEDLVRASPLEWTIVRAPLLTNGSGKGVYRSGEDVAARSPLPSLARADVADFMLRQLDDASFVRRTPRLMP
jgi:putative NADH-flavin reductase